MTISSNLQGNGVLRIVGFSLNQIPITSGDGPILSMDYISTNPYDAQVEVSIINSETILSDINANEINFSAFPGIISIDGDLPPDIIPPILLDAQPNYQNIRLTWQHPAPNEITGFNIYRDENLLTPVSYTHLTLPTNREV